MGICTYLYMVLTQCLGGIPCIGMCLSCLTACFLPAGLFQSLDMCMMFPNVVVNQLCAQGGGLLTAPLSVWETIDHMGG